MYILLEKLFQAQNLSKLESYQLFKAIINGQLNETQLSGALIAMKVRGETQEEIFGAVNALLDNVKTFNRPEYDFADIVGTGGDSIKTINISTASSLVAAACGVKIVKHGGKSTSDNFGSSEILKSLGINLNISSNKAREILDDLNICFLSASKYHTGFYHAIKVRQRLKTRTIFNILGPLVNPARPSLTVIGVYSTKLLRPIINILKILKYRHAIVVHGGGMDEVILYDINHIAELHKGNITFYHLTHKDFGFELQPKGLLNINTPEENHNNFMKLIRGKGDKSHEETVAANVAMILKVFGNKNLHDNAQYALKVIKSGKVYELLSSLLSRG
ncbi:anthranilate phosphoribosyltransferase [Candidatus Pantoea edessiphila]|uniref:Anthranilate phosphoribosyltransferase n=1 Tax=Candidatus Pantoea edessiphila TaxID=2044610 RepID=A0A2P5T2Q8_9GAMM|nr:anthranilate phosphoribosyltransferase [Candidatus Pantoea edessiphila]